MSISTHLAELAAKHRMLERKIAEELAHPAADGRKIALWKHEKLKVKEQIVRLENQTRH